MRKTILYLSGFMIISSLSVSCVSKKKFEELARAKREVDRNLLDLKRDKKQLEDQLQLAKDDFNTIRYKLTENNAVKDKTIDQLYTKLRSLESKQVELKSELSNVADQIKTTTQSTSEQISSLESSLQKVSNERDQLRRQLTEVQTNLEFENQKIKAQLESATNNLQAQNGEVEKLKADNEEMTKKLNWIRKTKADADAEIKKLTNQVNLLKKELLKRIPNAVTLPSFTSRDMRPGEVEGDHYHFISKEEFEEKIRKGDFYEYDLHHGNYYGTSRELMNNKIKEGKIIVKDIEVNGTENLLKILGNDTRIVTIFLKVGKEELKRRLIERGDNIQDIEVRLGRLEYEEDKIKLYDYVIKNDDFEKTVQVIMTIIENEKRIEDERV